MGFVLLGRYLNSWTAGAKTRQLEIDRKGMERTIVGTKKAMFFYHGTSLAPDKNVARLRLDLSPPPPHFLSPSRRE